MHFTYRLVHDDVGYAAECLEVEVAGEGSSEGEAVATLEAMLRERLLRPDAIAPPPEEPDEPIELTRVPAVNDPPWRS